MSGERTFLYSLLKGNYRLSKDVQKAIWDRLDAIELLAPAPRAPTVMPSPRLSGDLSHIPAHIASDPVVEVGQTAAAQAALASRQQAIAESIAGKVDKTTGRPRKF